MSTPPKTDASTRLNQEINYLIAHMSGSDFKVEEPPGLTYEKFLDNKMLMIAAIRAGIPYSLFELIKEESPFTETDWVEILDISGKSLQRYKQAKQHVFRPIHSEKIMEMAEVTHAGLEVFGSLDKFRSWLHTPAFAFGQLKPIELLKDSYGKDMVLGQLVRISHGIFV
jgi:putative toxin-antitoxin system antitoxin component (TIGR02293 family)